MSGGTIFRKQIADNGFGTGDNCLKIDRNYAYQVPLSFGDNWNKIKLGMFLSFVSGSELNAGTTAANGFEDAGGTTNDTFNWIGLVRNANTKSLPLDIVNQGFVGHKSNAITLEDGNTNSYYNKLCIFDTDATEFNAVNDGNALATSTFGTSTLSTGLIQDTAGNIATIYNSVVHSNLANPNLSGSVGEGGKGFCTYVGMTFEVHDKGSNSQRISMTMHEHTKAQSLFTMSTSRVSDVSMDALKFFMNSSDTTETQQAHTDGSDNATNQITGLIFNNGTSAHPLPDSFFYYNAMPQARPRIHAWAVKKFS
tara:strand:+ start:118 stop:1047 length:930 start_codon:yes stop_codon:yes gene_type:complete